MGMGWFPCTDCNKRDTSECVPKLCVDFAFFNAIENIIDMPRGDYRVKKYKNREDKTNVITSIVYHIYIPRSLDFESKLNELMVDLGENFDAVEKLVSFDDEERSWTVYNKYLIIDYDEERSFSDEEIQIILNNFSKGKYQRKDARVAHLCLLMYLGGYTLEKIGGVFGVSKEAIRKKIDRRISAAFGTNRKINKMILKKYVFVPFPVVEFFAELSKKGAFIDDTE